MSQSQRNYGRALLDLLGLLHPKYWLSRVRVYRNARPNPKMDFLLSLMDNCEDVEANDPLRDSKGHGG